MIKLTFHFLYLVILFYIFPIFLFADLHVGDGQTYTTIGAAMDVLAEKDHVYIHYKAAAFKEKFVVGFHNVTISGVCTAAGLCPIIEGSGAVAPSSQEYTNEDRGIIKIGSSNTPSSTCPENVIIENLHIRKARPLYKFTGNYAPSGINNYTKNAACVYIECAKNAIIRSNEIEDCGNGIFAGINNGESVNLMIEHNYVHNNGIYGSYYEHNLYTSAVGITYQFNHFGPLRFGCEGNNLKDRGVGSIVRYNWIEDGSRQIDLVEQYDPAKQYLRDLPNYDKAWVYGNVLFEKTVSGNRQIIHFGGDSGDSSTFRKGPLYAHYNTIISKRSDARSTLVRLSRTDSIAYFSNNIVHSDGSNQWELLSSLRGNLFLKNNFIKSGYIDAVSHTYGGTVSEEGTISTSDPGFVDFGNDDFGITSSSVCRGSATIMNCILEQYLPKHQFRNYTYYNVIRNNTVDLGANAFNRLYFNHTGCYNDPVSPEPTHKDSVGKLISGGGSSGGQAFGTTFAILCAIVLVCIGCFGICCVFISGVILILVIILVALGIGGYFVYGVYAGKNAAIVVTKAGSDDVKMKDVKIKKKKDPANDNEF